VNGIDVSHEVQQNGGSVEADGSGVEDWRGLLIDLH
jgi:hypothetical protein